MKSIYYVLLALVLVTGCETINDINPFYEEPEATSGGDGGTSSGGGGTTTNATPVTFDLYAQISGLEDTIVLTNGNSILAVDSDGRHQFAGNFEKDSSYNVQVSVQPSGQVCTVTEGSGTLTQDLVVTVNCETSCRESHFIDQSDYNVTRAEIGPNNALTRKTCQSILISEDTTLENISLFLRKETGGTTSGTVAIYEDVDGSSDCEAGTSISSSSASSYGNSTSWVTFEFADQPTLEAGRYRLVFTPDADSYVYAQNNSTSYAGGCMYNEMWFNFNWIWLRSSGSCGWDLTFRMNSNVCD